MQAASLAFGGAMLLGSGFAGAVTLRIANQGDRSLSTVTTPNFLTIFSICTSGVPLLVLIFHSRFMTRRQDDKVTK